MVYIEREEAHIASTQDQESNRKAIINNPIEVSLVTKNKKS